MCADDPAGFGDTALQPAGCLAAACCLLPGCCLLPACLPGCCLLQSLCHQLNVQHSAVGVLHFLQRDYLSRQLDLAPLDPVTGCGASEADHNALLACLQHAFEIEAPAQTAEGFFTQAVAATPLLTLVATQGCFEAVESLVAAGAPLGALDPAGWTALQHATQLGHTTVALVLVDANGDADLVAKGICQAQQAGHTQTADSIVQRAKDNQLNMHDLGTAVLREQARQEALVRCLDSPDSSGRSKSPTKAQVMYVVLPL